jgi:alkyl hydroperoxide reductase subunit D
MNQPIRHLLDELPAEARDLAVNIERIWKEESLSPEQRWGVALAAAQFIGHPRLLEAWREAAEAEKVDPSIQSDAAAAAIIMGMNTVYFRFRHLAKAEEYGRMPPHLRMTRMKQVATTEAFFELFSMGPAVLAGCALCVEAHEAALLKEGISREQIHDAVRLASVLQGLAVALR